MTPSLTDQRSSYPSQPSRVLPSKSLIVSDFPFRGGTTGASLSFWADAASGRSRIARARPAAQAASSQRLMSRLLRCGSERVHEEADYHERAAEATIRKWTV